MENTPAFHPLDYVSVVRRRMWWLIVPAVFAAVVGAALVMWLPRQYTGRATVGVTMPSVSSELVGRTQRVSAEERVAAVTQGLKNPVLLERIVKEEGLDKNTPTPDAIQALDRRISIVVPPTDPNLPPGTIMQFNIQYRRRHAGDDPAHHQSSGRTVRRGQLAQARGARGGNVRVRRYAAQ